MCCLLKQISFKKVIIQLTINSFHSRKLVDHKAKCIIGMKFVNLVYNAIKLSKFTHM